MSIVSGPRAWVVVGKCLGQHVGTHQAPNLGNTDVCLVTHSFEHGEALSSVHFVFQCLSFIYAEAAPPLDLDTARRQASPRHI